MALREAEKTCTLACAPTLSNAIYFITFLPPLTKCNTFIYFWQSLVMPLTSLLISFRYIVKQSNLTTSIWSPKDNHSFHFIFMFSLETKLNGIVYAWHPVMSHDLRHQKYILVEKYKPCDLIFTPLMHLLIYLFKKKKESKEINACTLHDEDCPLFRLNFLL